MFYHPPHLAVVLLDRYEEAHARLVVEAFCAEEVDEHEERLPHLHHVLHLQRVVRETERPGVGMSLLNFNGSIHG